MARPRKISEEQLIEIIKKYIENTPYISTLKYADLAKYAEKELGYKSITYQDFSRNKKTQEIIETYNDQKKISSYIRYNSDKLEKLSFDVDSVVDKYSNDLRQLKVILKVFKDGYDRAFSELIKYGESDTQNKETIKVQEQVIKELKEKNTELRAKLNSKTGENQESFRMEKLKYMYILLNDMINESHYYIETKEEIIDILKNFGYTSNDIANVEDILQNEFKIDNEVNKEELEEQEPISKDNVVSIKKSKLKLPDFMK